LLRSSVGGDVDELEELCTYRDSCTDEDVRVAELRRTAGEDVEARESVL
jgi:hypothetical protein